ncbi:hypothetical protein D3C76_1345180 [compost metagenome]
MTNDFPTSPAVILQYQCHWHFIMRKCYEWFNVVLAQFIEHFVIETQSFFIRFSIITVRENTRPVDR